MKRIALGLLLFVSPVIAADKEILPPEHLCMKVKGLEGRTVCDGGVPIDYSAFPLSLILDTIRADVFILGFDTANAYHPPPLTKEQEKEREMGRKVMEAAPYLVFPELGGTITKDTPAVAYCSSSVGNDVLDPWNAQNVRVTGKGRCIDFMTVYLRSAGK